MLQFNISKLPKSILCFLESLYINNTRNSINDKDRNDFSKIYNNIKNLN